MRLVESLCGGFDGLFVDILNERISTENRLEMARLLKDWLATTARVKPVSDLDARRERMNKRIDAMTQTATLAKVGDTVVVKAAGEGEDTLKMLENGTDWFDPCASVFSIVISALGKS